MSISLKGYYESAYGFENVIFEMLTINCMEVIN